MTAERGNAKVALTEVAESVGKGFFAGLVGTGVITASMTAEAKMRRQDLPPVQADAVEKIVGVEPRGEKEKQRLANLVHWQYGTAWGGVRGLLAALGLGPTAATLAHFFLVWSAAGIMLPALGLAPPPTKQPPSEIGMSALHHLLYAGVTTVVYEYLDSRPA
jgi:hypothetical protein